MSMPIFFVWNGSNNPEDARATGITRIGSPYNFIGAEHGLKTCVIGVVYVRSPHVRVEANGLHANLMMMPGANGALNARHVAHIIKEFPNAKVGDGWKTILAQLYASTQIEHYNGDNY